MSPRNKNILLYSSTRNFIGNPLFIYIRRYSTMPRSPLLHIPSLMSIVLVVSEMEIVVLSIANSNDRRNEMNEWSCGRVLSKVTSLVSADKSRRLLLWSGPSWKLFVEADNTFHANSILSSTESSGRCHLGWNKGRKSPSRDEAHLDDCKSRLSIGYSRQQDLSARQACCNGVPQ